MRVPFVSHPCSSFGILSIKTIFHSGGDMWYSTVVLICIPLMNNEIVVYVYLPFGFPNFVKCLFKIFVHFLEIWIVLFSPRFFKSSLYILPMSFVKYTNWKYFPLLGWSWTIVLNFNEIQIIILLYDSFKRSMPL